jgi:hypothetical protein
MSRKVRRASTRTPDIERVRQRIERWRRTRAKKTRMPEELWAAATSPARTREPCRPSMSRGTRKFRVDFLGHPGKPHQGSTSEAVTSERRRQNLARFGQGRAFLHGAGAIGLRGGQRTRDWQLAGPSRREARSQRTLSAVDRNPRQSARQHRRRVEMHQTLGNRRYRHGSTVAARKQQRRQDACDRFGRHDHG